MLFYVKSITLNFTLKKKNFSIIFEVIHTFHPFFLLYGIMSGYSITSIYHFLSDRNFGSLHFFAIIKRLWQLKLLPGHGYK